MDNLSDDDLMRLFGEGSRDAFGALFARHHASVYRFARLMLQRPDAADEVLQETFLAALRGAGRYLGEGRFRPWLLKIARNLCLNRLAAARARRAVSMALGEQDPPDRPGAASPASAAEQADEVARIESAVGELPPRQREAIALYALHDMSYAEIAQAMDTPLNTVKTLIRRGRVTLAGRLCEGHNDAQ